MTYQISNSQPMFLIPFLHLEVCDWESKKKDIINLMNLQQLDYDNQVVTDFHFQNKNKFRYLSDVEFIFKEELNIFYNFFELQNLKLNSCWFEISSENQFHQIHNHGPTGYSSVCFVDYDENIHTPTHFISPFSNFISGNCLEFIPKGIKEGSVIFFPSSILHYTLPSFNSKKRTILSFNIK